MEFDLNLKRYEVETDVKNIVYFLMKDDEVVYIGHTTRGIKRILEHFNNKDFNNYAFYETDEEKLFDLEKKLIRMYMPKYNNEYYFEKKINGIDLSFQSVRKSLNKKYDFTLIYGFHNIWVENMVEFCKQNNIKFYNVNRTKIFYSEEDKYKFINMIKNEKILLDRKE